MMPGPIRARVAVSAAPLSSQSRNPPTVRCANFGEGLLVMRIKDQARDFIGFVRRERLFQETPQRYIGQRYFSGHAFFGIVCRQARQFVARASGVALASNV